MHSSKPPLEVRQVEALEKIADALSSIKVGVGFIAFFYVLLIFAILYGAILGD